jgi:hypothetical protein
MKDNLLRFVLPAAAVFLVSISLGMADAGPETGTIQGDSELLNRDLNGDENGRDDDSPEVNSDGDVTIGDIPIESIGVDKRGLQPRRDAYETNRKRNRDRRNRRGRRHGNDEDSDDSSSGSHDESPDEDEDGDQTPAHP